jgi:hypothetical protein
MATKNVMNKGLEISERVVAINRVSKVVKGGKRFKFSVLVVVGDNDHQVGMGLGKAREISEAVRKGIEKAKKNLVDLRKVGNTIPHPVIADFGAARVMLKPAAPERALSPELLSEPSWSSVESKTCSRRSSAGHPIPSTLPMQRSRRLRPCEHPTRSCVFAGRTARKRRGGREWLSCGSLGNGAPSVVPTNRNESFGRSDSNASTTQSFRRILPQFEV